MRLVNSEVSRKIEELKRDLNSQKTETLNSVTNERILPNFQNSMIAKILCFGKKWTPGPGDLAEPPNWKILKVLANPTQSPFRLSVIRVVTSGETQLFPVLVMKITTAQRRQNIVSWYIPLFCFIFNWFFNILMVREGVFNIIGQIGSFLKKWLM